MVLKSKCKTQDHSQVQFFTRRTHRTQHVSVLTVKVYYAERIQSRTDRKKGHVEKSRGNQCKLPRAYSEVIKDVLNPSSNQEHVCVVYQQSSLKTQYPTSHSQDGYIMKTDSSKCDEDIEKLKPPYLFLGENKKWFSSFGKI